MQSIALRQQHAVLWLELQSAEFILNSGRDIMCSNLFRELKEAMESAERYVNTLIDELASRLDTARKIVERTMRALEDAIKSGDLDFNSLMAAAQDVLDKAKKDCEGQARESTERKILLDVQKESTKDQSSKSVALLLRRRWGLREKTTSLSLQRRKHLRVSVPWKRQHILQSRSS
jgi:hypothetical protein